MLEVRSREVPFILEHGQIVGRLVYERMLARPSTLYGQRIGSNYQAQGLIINCLTISHSTQAVFCVALHGRSVIRCGAEYVACRFNRADRDKIVAAVRKVIS